MLEFLQVPLSNLTRECARQNLEDDVIKRGDVLTGPVRFKQGSPGSPVSVARAIKLAVEEQVNSGKQENLTEEELAARGAALDTRNHMSVNPFPQFKGMNEIE